MVADSDKDLQELITDGDYLDYSANDAVDAAKVYVNGVGTTTYSTEKGNVVAGKGDIIDVYENNNGTIKTIVVRSYTYAKIDSVDKDLSKTLKNRGASVELSLVDINGGSFGNGDYYDDYNQDAKVLNGYTSDYKEGTVLAVAQGAAGAILDSYVAETVTGTPSAAKKVAMSKENTAMVASGNITVGGTKYNYAATMTGLTSDETVDFNKEYNLYLTAQGYVLAVDGEVSASLNDVYYVIGAYKETKGGAENTYVQAVALKDGTLQELKLDKNPEVQKKALFDAASSASAADTLYVNCHGLYQLSENSGKWSGNAYNGTKYVSTGEQTLQANVTSSSSVVRTNGVYYLSDSTNFISVECDANYNIDVKTATGVMSMDKDKSADLKVTVIHNDKKDALYVIYTGTALKGATSSSSIVYLDGQPDTKNKDGWEGSVWFMDGLKNQDVTADSAYAQGFWRYTVNSDGVYELSNMNADKASTDAAGYLASDATGVAADVCFTTAKNTVITNGTATVDGTKYYDTIKFVGVSMSGATVIDTRSSSDMKADVYSNEINSTSKLVTALNKANVAADVYVENGKITFIAVKAVDAK